MADLPDTTTPGGIGTIIGATEWSPMRDWIRELLTTLLEMI